LLKKAVSDAIPPNSAHPPGRNEVTIIHPIGPRTPRRMTGRGSKSDPSVRLRCHVEKARNVRIATGKTRIVQRNEELRRAFGA